MGRYTWLGCHGEVHLAMVSWGGTPGYGVMGDTPGYGVMGEVHLARVSWGGTPGYGVMEEVHLAMVSWRRYTWLWCHGEVRCHAVSDVHFQLTLLHISALTHNHTNWKDLTHALFITRTHTPHTHTHAHTHTHMTHATHTHAPIS